MPPAPVEFPAFSGLFAARAATLPHKAAPTGFHTPNLRSPTSAVIEHVRNLVSSYEPIIERREAPRLSVTFSARAVALDDQLRPVGDEFFLVVRNISATGLGLLSTTPVKSTFLAIELATDGGETLHVAIEVRRCQPIGPCFDVGGRFVLPTAC
jgi:hypothetical protein